MNLAELQQQQAKLTKQIEGLSKLPALEGYWIDSATDQGYTEVRYRLCHFTGERYANGKLKKRRQSIRPHELARIRAQVERGSQLKSAKAELAQVKAAIATIEHKIRELTGG
ncbi:MAG: hypothetical protein AAGE59_29695 [Cyanobacteria bacterium P01_F01_bin.86]